jgi:putative membrane protein
MKRLTAMALSASVAGTIALPARVQSFPDHMGSGQMGMWSGNWGWGHMMVGGVMMLLFWGAVIGLVFLIVRSLAGSY